MRRLFSILFWLFFALSGLGYYLIAVLIWLLSTPFDRQRRLNHMWSCVWGSTYAFAYPGWNIRVTGRHNIDKKTAYVLVANHTSIADIVLCFTLFRQFKWISKTAVFRYPLLGWNMRLCRYIPLERGEKASIEQMMESCRDWLRHGMSILMFPEGTRSPNGKLQSFKHGAFTLAKDTGAAVLPIAIHGGHNLIAKHEGTFAPRAELWVEILPPIPTDAAPDVDALSALARAAIHSSLTRINPTLADDALPSGAHEAAHTAH